MTLEEAQAKIQELTDQLATKDETIVGLKDSAGKISDEDRKKIEQKAYNQGFDKAKNQAAEDIKGFVSKEDVDNMLSEREKAFKTQKELLSMGIKNPEKAMKIIDEEDLASFGTESFKSDDFKTKYGDVLVFKESEAKAQETKPFTKNNSNPNPPKLTAEAYAEMSKEERMKIPKEDRDALL